jgi:hypothetical protein
MALSPAERGLETEALIDSKNLPFAICKIAHVCLLETISEPLLRDHLDLP